MLRSLYTGVSGLKNYQTKLEVVGNNIANANTTAFKRSRVSMHESFSQTLRQAAGPGALDGGHNAMQVGLGSAVGSVDRMHEQGNLELTGQVTDLALMGDGWFMLDEGGRNVYTRNGAFQFNALGTLVDQAGRSVLGLSADENGGFPALSEAGAITLPQGLKEDPLATSSVSFRSNLDADATSSVASLLDGGAGISSVEGSAVDGIGGVTTVEIVATPAGSTFEQLVSDTLVAESSLSTQLSSSLTDFSGPLSISLALHEDPTSDQTTAISESIDLSGLPANASLLDVADQIRAQSDYIDYRINDAGTLEFYSSNWQVDSFEMSEDAATPVLSTFFNGDISLERETTFTVTQTFTADDGSIQASSFTLYAPTNALNGEIDDLPGLREGLSFNTLPGGLGEGSFSFATAATSHTTSITVYDSLGQAWPLDVSFTRAAEDNTWTWTAQVDGAEVLSGGSGEIRFDNNGVLASFNYDGGAESFEFQPEGADPVSIRFDPGTIGSNDGITQSARDFSTQAYSQNGYAMGVLEELDIAADGTVSGAFSNGHTKVLAQLVLARFANDPGLKAEGESVYAATGASGSAELGTAGETFDTAVQAGYLEMSNTDLTKEFTEMIVAQRGYQASAKIITTSDTLLDEAIRIKR